MTTAHDPAPNLTPVLGRYFQREWSHGQGHRLFDTDGRAYLDFANGIAVTALGHAHPRVTAAIHAQVDKLIGPISAIGFTEPISRLATDLAATFPDPLDAVMFLNSGSEAIDGALKLARRLEAWMQDGRDVARLIGGADGLDEEFKQQADDKLRLSSLTLPHGMARLVLCEQLYRAVSVLKNHPYHREG